MPKRYYDVIAVGRSIGTLAAAALLARRDFTVLVVGNKSTNCDYHFDDVVLRRRTPTMLAARTPAWRRILGELAYTQTYMRRVQRADPMVQFIDGHNRFEIPPDAAAFASEISREFPRWRRVLADFYADLTRVTAAADEAFDADVVWPPGAFLERRETGRLANRLPYAQTEPHADLLAELPPDHSYRRIVEATVRFASHLSTPPPAFAAARLHGGWTRGLLGFPNGESELFDLLVGRLEANGGAFRPGDHVERLDVNRSGVVSVFLDSEEDAIGAGYVVTDMLGERLAALSAGHGIRKKALREWPRITPQNGRYAMSIAVWRGGLPDALGTESFILGDGTDGDPTIHLCRMPGRAAGTKADDHDLLVAEVLLSERQCNDTYAVRGTVLSKLCRSLPFLERHLRVVDSVYDGLGLWRYPSAGAASNTRLAPPAEVDRTFLRGSAVPAEPMPRQLHVDPEGYLGLAGEPVRGPLERSLLVGPSVLPGLGQEGELIAALSAVRLITQADRRRARMRRELWTKLEIS